MLQRTLLLCTLGMAMPASESRTFVLGGGCFWCLEAAFETVPGVSAVVSGYAGGHRDLPTYEEVCRGDTGHAEVVAITYDPTVVGLDGLLKVFFAVHDPTTRDRQGHDIGPQYRSLVLAADDAELAAVRAAVAAEQARWIDPIVTELALLATTGPARFHPAEDHHQDYFRRHPNQGYCQAVVRPKVAAAKAVVAATQPVTVRDLNADLTLGPASPQARVVLSDAQWRAKLDPAAFSVLRHAGTEPPFCGGFLAEKRSGWFTCAGCGLPLFASTAKFDSGTGWPSFLREAAPENLVRIVDKSHGMVRTEIRCARCDGHLGHVFDDGPAPTFTRHCLNSAALTFRPAPAEALPPH